MEFFCEACEARTRPAQVWRSATGVALECAACGHLNRVEADAGPTAAPGGREASVALRAGGGAAQTGSAAGGGAAAGEAAAGEDSAPAATEADSAPAAATPAPAPPSDPLTPDVEGRVRCPKCAHAQRDRRACDRCGFAFDNYQPGQMPWERPPAGQEAAWEEAQALWAAIEAAPKDAAAHERFMAHCQASGLEELAARRYRLRLAEAPRDAVAQAQLEAMVRVGQRQLMARLEVDREREQGRAGRVRQALLLLVTAGLVAALTYFLLRSSWWLG